MNVGFRQFTVLVIEIVVPPIFQGVAGNGDTAASGGEERKHELQDNFNEIGSGSGSGNDDGNRARDEGAASSAGEEQGGQDAPPNPFGDRGVRDGWVVFATHPQRGRFVINEGVVLVIDRYVVCGGVRQGFYIVTMPAPVRAAIRENVSLPIPPHTVTFPQLDMLTPVIGRISNEVASIADAGHGEVNPPQDGPNPDPKPEPIHPNPEGVQAVDPVGHDPAGEATGPSGDTPAN